MNFTKTYFLSENDQQITENLNQILKQHAGMPREKNKFNNADTDGLIFSETHII